MHLNEFHTFNIKDAVKFHKELNPKIFNPDKKMDPEVRDQLLIIAKDFVTELGIKDLDVEDVTVSGSNAAYSYTDNSDLDLHILVDFSKLPDDEIYQELFLAKKTVYNDSHDITVRGIPVELYVQDSNQPHITLGEYSLLNNKWTRIPTKDRANFNQIQTQAKYEKLLYLIKRAIASKDYDKVQKAWDTLKRYRKAGLESAGEFGPENLAYKALRNQGYVQKLYDTKNKLHSKKLSIDEMDEDYDPNGPPPGPEFKPTMPAGTVRVDVSDVYDWYKLGQNISNLDRVDKKIFGKGPPSTIMAFGSEEEEHKYINALKKLGLNTTDIDPIDKNQPPGMPRQAVDPTYNVNEILDTKSKAPFYNMGGDIDKQVPFKTKSGRRYGIDFISALDAHSRPRLRQFPKIKPKLLRYKDEIIDNGVEVVFGQDDYMLDNPTGITGTGSAAEVFGIVTNKIIEYIKKFNPPYLYFTSFDDEPSRVKLYHALLRRVMPTLPGYFYKVIKIENSYQFVIFDQDFFVGDTINEILDTVPGKTNKAEWYYGDPSMITLDFVASNGQPYELYFLDVGLAPEQIDPYEMLPDASDQYYDNGYFVEFEQKHKRNPSKKGKQGIEGTGAAAEVFGIVTNAILQFAKKKKPTYLYFQAAEDSRIKLYSALVKRLLPSFPGWKLIGPTSDGVFMLYSPIKKKVKTQESASGYIPSYAEKDDPRFSTALTVDIKPDSLKKNAKAFGFNISRAGIPPDLRPNGQYKRIKKK